MPSFVRSSLVTAAAALAACGSAPRSVATCPATPPAPVAAMPTPAPAPAPTAAPAATPSAAETLAALGIVPYPDEAPPVPDDWFATRTLAPDDVAADFGNLDDLAWLKPIAVKSRVLLFGEAHYYQVTHHLAARVLFALERYDHYGLLTVEQAYSLGPFLDHYVSIADDVEAKAFYDANLASELELEDRELLDHVRAWNHAHPDRTIHVAAHDLEHDFHHVLGAVIAPYFAQLGADHAIDAAQVGAGDLVALSDQLAGWLPAARARKLHGAQPFVDADYVARVIDNLRSTGLSYADGNDFTYYRQRAIIRNLTDPRFLGRWFKTGKVMVWAGAYHTVDSKPMADGGNFLREGTYLAYEFAPTKGKTFSLASLGFAYSLGEMADVDPKTIGFAGTAYTNTLTKLHDARVKGLIDPARAYFVNGEEQGMVMLIAALAKRGGDAPFLLDKVAWDQIEAAMPSAKSALDDARRELTGYDAVVIVPRSPLTRRAVAVAPPAH